MANIRMVAKEAGVSTATVSRVINNSNLVTPETAERVLRVVQDMGYSTNRLGVNLRKNQSNLVLVLLPTLTNEFYTELLEGISSCADEHNYNVVIGDVNHSSPRANRFLQLANHRQVDGVILSHHLFSPDHLNQLIEKVPVVQCCGYDPVIQTVCVTTNDIRASYEAVKYLLDIGHKRIGYLGVMLDGQEQEAEREKGYKRALLESGIACNENWLGYTPSYDFGPCMSAAEQYLNCCPELDAVFCANDVLAYSVIRAAQKIGKQIPEDLSVVGYDNISLSQLAYPSITTISQNRKKIGYDSMKKLLNQISGEEEPQALITYVEHELIIRDSTAPKTASGTGNKRCLP